MGHPPVSQSAHLEPAEERGRHVVRMALDLRGNVQDLIRRTITASQPRCDEEPRDDRRAAAAESAGQRDRVGAQKTRRRYLHPPAASTGGHSAVEEVALAERKAIGALALNDHLPAIGRLDADRVEQL